MVLPNLIHPTLVVIERINTAATIQDPDYEEPVQVVDRSNQVTVLGQPKWRADKRLDAKAYGPDEESDGYVLFRRIDLQAAGVDDINRGDRFISIGIGANLREVDLYVTSIRPEGHYTDQGGASLLKAFFRGRHPVHQSRGG